MTYTDLILQQPQSGSYLKARDMVGHRVGILAVHSIEDEPDNMNPGKMRKVATIDLVDLDDGNGGEFRENVKVDKPGIVNRLSSAGRGSLVTGKGVLLGRIEVGQAEAGKNPPFLLGEHQPADAAAFGQWWAANAAQVLTVAAPVAVRAATPAPAYTPAPAATPAPAPAAYVPAPAPAYTPAPAAAPAPPPAPAPAPAQQMAIPLGPDGRPDLSQMPPETQALYAQLQATGVLG